ncbi:hypothetical protein ACFCYH_38000 [Streptomyces sp. NPDC056400]|uniref:hypothetical protein n=1 Tax=Streptomyces sp. NPDC056400 TaxID=3345808 RepID=UPI0035E36DBD
MIGLDQERWLTVRAGIELDEVRDRPDTQEVHVVVVAGPRDRQTFDGQSRHSLTHLRKNLIDRSWFAWHSSRPWVSKQTLMDRFVWGLMWMSVQAFEVEKSRPAGRSTSPAGLE